MNHANRLGFYVVVEWIVRRLACRGPPGVMDDDEQAASRPGVHYAGERGGPLAFIPRPASAIWHQRECDPVAPVCFAAPWVIDVGSWQGADVSADVPIC